ncbi:MAG: hypothetical protein L3J58_12785 [Emcibacter sp.]|nr:hypothetical protein [Emcibacter sp.]
MNIASRNFIPHQNAPSKKTTFDMINALTHLCHKAEEAHLDLVSFHLNLAFEELKNSVMVPENNIKDV